jgi:hypothetical protein
MLTRSEEGQFRRRRAGNGLVARTGDRVQLSFRLSDAPVGGIALVSIVSSVLVIPLSSSFGGKGTVLSRALSIVILLFAPAILGAIYSLFFEKSKAYGAVDLLLAGIALLVQPLTWYWLKMYLPFAFGFTIFCAAVRQLQQRGRE